MILSLSSLPQKRSILTEWLGYGLYSVCKVLVWLKLFPPLMNQVSNEVLILTLKVCNDLFSVLFCVPFMEWINCFAKKVRNIHTYAFIKSCVIYLLVQNVQKMAYMESGFMHNSESILVAVMGSTILIDLHPSKQRVLFHRHILSSFYTSWLCIFVCIFRLSISLSLLIFVGGQRLST